MKLLLVTYSEKHGYRVSELQNIKRLEHYSDDIYKAIRTDETSLFFHTKGLDEIRIICEEAKQQ